jgi:hypothetical protein
MPRLPRADFLVSGVLGMAARIARHNLPHPDEFLVNGFRAPKATAPERGVFQSFHIFRFFSGQSFRFRCASRVFNYLSPTREHRHRKDGDDYKYLHGLGVFYKNMSISFTEQKNKRMVLESFFSLGASQIQARPKTPYLYHRWMFVQKKQLLMSASLPLPTENHTTRKVHFKQFKNKGINHEKFL